VTAAPFPSFLDRARRVLGGAAFERVVPSARPRWRPRWTIRGLMLAILLSAVALGLLRIRWGLIFALMAGGVVGCGLAPRQAIRALRKLDGELAGRPGLDSRTKAVLLAQSYVLVWAAWYFAGVLVAMVGAAAWWILGHAR
jgi:hypothetical protein